MGYRWVKGALNVISRAMTSFSTKAESAEIAERTTDVVTGAEYRCGVVKGAEILG